MSNSAQQMRDLVSGAITMIDKAVNNELSLSAQFCVGCLLSVKEALAKVLAVPLRECDVGSAVEQTDRFWGYCNAHSCNECPARGGWRTVYIDGTSFKMIQCGVPWAQMPYKENEVAK